MLTAAAGKTIKVHFNSIVGVYYAHPLFRRVSKVHRPWAYNTYSTIL